MKRQTYLVTDKAGPEMFGRAVKPGDELRLTESEAMYDRDMGRLISEEDAKAQAAAAEAARTSVETTTYQADVEIGGVQAGDGTVMVENAEGLTLPDSVPADKLPLTPENAERVADETTGLAATRTKRGR